MLFRAPTLFVVALSASYALATAPKTCNPGQYRDSNGDCQTCADGYFSPASSVDLTTPYECQPCPIGQESSNGHDSCKKCDPGEYNDTPGTMCKDCKPGYFNKNVQGAKACCRCCAGFYSNTQKTDCNKCPEARPYSYPESNTNDACVDEAGRGDRPEPATTCDMQADNVCPNPTGPGPTGSPINAKKKRGLHCTKGFQSCPHYSGRGGFECVDTQNDPESCGGCVSLDGKGSGTDCTALEGVSVTRCAAGSCVIDACRKGYAKSLDGSSCVSVSSVDGSNPEAFSSQNLGATTKRGSPAKRAAIRGRIF